MSVQVSIPLFVGLAIQVVGLLLHIIGLATPHWSVWDNVPLQISLNQTTFTTTNLYFGLWRACVDSKCVDITTNDNIRAAEAFAVIGLVFGGGGTGLALINVLMSIAKKPFNKIVFLFSLIASGVAFSAIDVSAAIWAAGVNIGTNFSLGYSIWLAIAGSVLLPVGSLFGIMTIWQSQGVPVLRQQYI